MIFSNIVPEIIDKFREGLIVLNDRNEIIFSNRSANKILRLPKKINGSLSIDKLFKEPNPELYDFITLSKKEQKYKKPGIINFYQGNSKSKLYITPFIPNEPENVKLYYYIFSDTTELWNLHKKEMQLLSQLKKSYTDQMDNLRQIAQSVAHEIRNPLVSIGGYANMLIKKCQTTPPAKKDIKEYVKYLKYIESDAERLSIIINQVENYSDVTEIKLKRKNISIMINNLLMYGEKITKQYDIPANFLIDIPVEYMVYTDERKLKGALQKLISQSFLLSNIKKPLSMNIRTTPYELILVIKVCTDLQKEEISFLFSPFYSPPGQKLTFDFASAQRIIILHGGNINATWQTKGILQFKVSLPKEKRLSNE